MLYELILINEIEQRANIIFLSAHNPLVRSSVHFWPKHFTIKKKLTSFIGMVQNLVCEHTKNLRALLEKAT